MDAKVDCLPKTVGKRYTIESLKERLRNSGREHRETFKSNETKAKTLIVEAQEVLRSYKQREHSSPKLQDEENKLLSLIDTVRDLLDSMQDVVDDLNALKEKKSVRRTFIDDAETVKGSLETLSMSYREVKRAYQLAKESKTRQDLFSSTRSPFDTIDNSPKKRPTEISSNATETLLRSRRILQETVQFSDVSLASLAATTSTVSSNLEELKVQKGLIDTSHKLLGKYGRREFTEKILFTLAIVMFFSCVLYVVHKRLL